MTSLRQRMLEDMQIRNLAVNTQESYVQQGLTVCTLLQPVTRAVGTGADSRLSGLLDQRKEVSHRFDPYRHFRASLPV